MCNKLCQLKHWTKNLGASRTRKCLIIILVKTKQASDRPVRWPVNKTKQQSSKEGCPNKFNIAGGVAAGSMELNLPWCTNFLSIKIIHWIAIPFITLSFALTHNHFDPFTVNNLHTYDLIQSRKTFLTYSIGALSKWKEIWGLALCQKKFRDHWLMSSCATFG